MRRLEDDGVWASLNAKLNANCARIMAVSKVPVTGLRVCGKNRPLATQTRSQFGAWLLSQFQRIHYKRECVCQTNFQADDEEERIFVESHIRNLQSLPHAMRKEMNTCQNILLRTAAKQIHRQASRNSTVSYPITPITPKGEKLRLATKNIREKLIFQTVIH